MTYDALRRGRYSAPGNAYHVTIVTAERAPLFSDLFHARAIVGEMRRCDQAARSATLAWALMPDHLHWLFVLGPDVSLAKILHGFKGRSARELNRLRGGLGPVWQRGYHDHAVRGQEDVLTIARYLVGNPLRAGLVDDLGQYPHWDAVWLP
ncbi:MAG: transposase [Rhodocyclaceae bacterium]|jgi:REP element-mobilizing transposase RayT|nr:transposase [Rhodocyclaceae bacterium]